MAPIQGLPGSSKPGGETPGQTPVEQNYIVFMLDKSGSMGWPAPGGPGIVTAKEALKSFLCALDSGFTGDHYAVLAFNQATQVVIEGAAPNTFKKDLTDGISTADADAIDAIVASGSTNMNAAFQKANQYLAPFCDVGVTNNWSIPNKIPFFLMLSDGMWNVGGDPKASRDTYRKYTGDGTVGTPIDLYVSQAGLFDTLKLETLIGTLGVDGDYVEDTVACTPSLLFSAFSYITKSETIMTTEAAMSDIQPIKAEAPIPDGGAYAIFQVVWNDTSLKFTNEAPGAGEIQVVLKGKKKGENIFVQPSCAGNGYAVFKEREADGGIWEVVAVTSGSKPNKSIAMAGFIRPNPELKGKPAETYTLDVPRTLELGKPLTITGNVVKDRAAIKDMEGVVTIKRPSISYEDAIKKYATELANISPYGKYLRIAATRDIAKLLTLRDKYLQYGKGDILPRTIEHLTMDVDVKKGTLKAVSNSTKIDGKYSIEVTAKWREANSQTPMQSIKKSTMRIAPPKSVKRFK